MRNYFHKIYNTTEKRIQDIAQKANAMLKEIKKQKAKIIKKYSKK